MGKKCVYGTCKSDSRYPQKCIGVKWIPFAKPGRHGYHLEKCLRWIKACGRPDSELNITKIKKWTYVCSKHFIDGKPTDEHPDPICRDVIVQRKRSKTLISTAPKGPKSKNSDTALAFPTSLHDYTDGSLDKKILVRIESPPRSSDDQSAQTRSFHVTLTISQEEKTSINHGTNKEVADFDNEFCKLRCERTGLKSEVRVKKERESETHSFCCKSGNGNFDTEITNYLELEELGTDLRSKRSCDSQTDMIKLKTVKTESFSSTESNDLLEASWAATVEEAQESRTLDMGDETDEELSRLPIHFAVSPKLSSIPSVMQASLRPQNHQSVVLKAEERIKKKQHIQLQGVTQPAFRLIYRTF